MCVEDSAEQLDVARAYLSGCRSVAFSSALAAEAIVVASLKTVHRVTVLDGEWVEGLDHSDLPAPKLSVGRRPLVEKPRAAGQVPVFPGRGLPPMHLLALTETGKVVNVASKEMGHEANVAVMWRKLMVRPRSHRDDWARLRWPSRQRQAVYSYLTRNQWNTETRTFTGRPTGS